MPDTGSNSRLITLLSRISIGCLVAMPLSVAAVRLGIDFRLGLLVFALSGVIAALVIVAMLVVSLLPRYREERLRALKWAVPAVPPALLVAAILSTGGKYPPIHDITTDTEDPPRFDSGVYYRGEEANPLDIKPEVIETQQQFYPELDTIQSDLSPEDAFDRATRVAESLGWEIYNSDPANGRIEASVTSFWFGFVDDVVIRVRMYNGGSEIDLRSVSRVGESDLGANAARIKAFTESF